MYITDANGKIVQFSYHKDDSDDEIYVSKPPQKQMPPAEQTTFGGGGSPKKEPAMRLETVEDDFENDKELKELSLYKKLVV